MEEVKNRKMKGTKMVCDSCGGHFDEMLPKCPYCDSTNIKGAQAEYMEKLEDVRSDMEELAQVPVQETRKELKKQTRFILQIIGVILVITGIWAVVELFLMFGFGDKSEEEKQADYQWKQEQLTVFDEAYEQGNDEELMKLYYEAAAENKPVYEWEHSNYSSALTHYKEMEYVWEKIERGEPPMSLNEYTGLLVGYSFVEYYYNKLTQEEKEKFAHYYEKVKEDYEARWDFQGKEWEAVEKARMENSGIIPYETAEKYVEAWLERQGK